MKKEKIVIICGFIAISLYVIITALRYPSVPGSMGPGFFPILAATLLAFLSGLELVLTLLGRREPGKEDIKQAGLGKITLVIAMLITAVLVMRCIHPMVGIAAFLFSYLLLVSRTKLLQGALVSVVGTGAVWVAARLLQIPF